MDASEKCLLRGNVLVIGMFISAQTSTHLSYFLMSKSLMTKFIQPNMTSEKCYDLCNEEKTRVAVLEILFTQCIMSQKSRCLDCFSLYDN